MFYYVGNFSHLAILRVGWLGADSVKEVDVKQWGHNKVKLYMKRQEATESSP